MTPSHPIVFLIDVGNTTVFARQGSYAHDPTMLDAFPPADVTIERIADLLEADLPRPRLTPPILTLSLESTR
jgi:hypothetical protein